MKVEFKGNKGEHSAVSRLLFVHCSYKTPTAAVPREGGPLILFQFIYTSFYGFKTRPFAVVRSGLAIT